MGEHTPWYSGDIEFRVIISVYVITGEVRTRRSCSATRATDVATDVFLLSCTALCSDRCAFVAAAAPTGLQS